MKTWYRGGGFVLAWLVAGLLTTPSLAQGAQIFGLYATGAGGSAGETDTHYTIVQEDTGEGLPALIRGSTRRLWLASSGASWLTPAYNTYRTGQGDYVYRLTFDLVDSSGDALNPSTAFITGLLAANRYCTVLLNGSTVADLSQTGYRRQFRKLIPFSLNSGFVSGANTLDFIVHKRLLFPRRTGLLVTDLSGTAEVGNIPVVPEPKPIALLALGLAGLMAAKRIRANRRTLEAAPVRSHRQQPLRRVR